MKTQNTPDPASGTSGAKITDNTNKTGECAYCGDVGIITRDHVPPKGIFPKPRPENLITVPACRKCHSQQTSRDDEYFRNTLNVREDLSQHPGVLKVQPVVLRSFSNPNKSGMLGEFLKSIRLIEQVTPAGIIIKSKLGFEADMVRIRRVVQRIVIGLFYHHRQHRMPVGYDALIFNEESLQEWPADVLDYVTKTILQPLLATNVQTRGNGVFSYRFAYHPADPDSTWWILDFYERARFLGQTVPPVKNI